MTTPRQYQNASLGENPADWSPFFSSAPSASGDASTSFLACVRRRLHLPAPKKYILVSTLFTIVVLSVSFGIITSLTLPGVDDRIPHTAGSTSTQITLVANFLDVDATARTVNIDWFPFPDRCNSSEVVVDIYVDPNLLVPSSDPPSAPASSAPPSSPVFHFNSTEYCIPANHNSFNVFRTSFRMTGRPTPGALNRESLQAYPLDQYIFQVSMYALLSSTKESVGIILGKSFGTPVNFDIKLDKTISSNNEEGILLSFVASRSKAVIAFVFLVIIVNWIVTLAFLWITTAAFVFEETVIKEMFALPIASLFAFTSVRAKNYLARQQVSAPSSVSPRSPRYFRALLTRPSSDYYGILPTLALMTFFSAILLLIVLVRRIRDAAPETRALQQPASDPESTDREARLRHAFAMLNKTVSDLKLGTAALKVAAEELDTVADELEDAVTAVVQNLDPSAVPVVATAPSLGATSTIDTAVSGPVQAVPAKSGSAGNVSWNESLEMYPMTGKLEHGP